MLWDFRTWDAKLFPQAAAYQCAHTESPRVLWAFQHYCCLSRKDIHIFADAQESSRSESMPVGDSKKVSSGSTNLNLSLFIPHESLWSSPFHSPSIWASRHCHSSRSLDTLGPLCHSVFKWLVLAGHVKARLPAGRYSCRFVMRVQMEIVSKYRMFKVVDHRRNHRSGVVLIDS